NRRHLNSIRLAYASAANSLAESNRKEDAKKLLHKVDSMILEENMPYGMVSRNQFHNSISMQLLLATYKAGDMQLAEKITNALRKDMEQQQVYYNSLRSDRRDAMMYEERRNDDLLRALLS